MQTFVFPSSSLQRQRGDFLIESLIGLVLMAIIGLGVVFVTSRMSIAHKDMRMQEIAVNQMRALLLNNGSNGINICASPPTVKLPSLDIPATVIGCGETITASVHGKTINNISRPLFISLNHEVLGGEIIVGGSTP